MAGYSVHLLCNGGNGGFTYRGKKYEILPGDLAVLTNCEQLKDLRSSDDFSIEYVAMPTKYLFSLLPVQSIATGTKFRLNADAVIHLTDEEMKTYQTDMRGIRDRLAMSSHTFYREVVSTYCLAMLYDLFHFHSIRHRNSESSDRRSYVVRQLMVMLESGTCTTEREVSYYAARLNVTPKYLSDTVRRNTGDSVTAMITSYTLPIVESYLGDNTLSFTQIADLMNFHSLSYFSRYVTKHFGMSPSDIRSGKRKR